MKKNIFQKMFLVAICSVILTSILLFSSLYIVINNQTKRELKDVALYFSSVLESDNYDITFLEENNIFSNVRITYIDFDGQVLYDNQTSASTMENHLLREEVQSAIRDGESFSTRFSETLANQTEYYAYRLNDGTIIRTSILTSSIFAIVAQNIPAIFFILVVIFLITLLIANFLTKKIIEPINQINLKAPLKNEVYEEFTPMLRKINQQNKLINQQIYELKQKELEFTSVTKYMKEGLLFLNKTGDILFMNESIAMILDTQINTENINYRQYIRNQELKEAVDDAMLGHKIEKTILVKNKWYQMNVSPIEIEDNLQGIVILFLDVTEQFETEKRRREFSGNVSHELKTPLQSISGYAEIISQGLVNKKDIPVFSQKIYNESQRLIKLINEIIMLSQLDEGATSKEAAVDIDMRGLTQTIIEELTEKAKQNNITFEISGETFTIRKNYSLLYELVHNLIENAIKYNKKDGTISIELTTKNEKHMVRIRDTGIGIKESDLPYIFERFYRGDKSRAKTIEGTGIGLSLVKHIAEIQNISLEVESIEGVGTTFTITFEAE